GLVHLLLGFEECVIDHCSAPFYSPCSSELSCPPASARTILLLLILLPSIQAGDQIAALLAADGPDDVPLAHEREHHDRQPVVHAQGDRRGVHHLQPAAEVLTVVQP